MTGGSRGIGRAVAEALAAQGARVVVTYVKGEAEARKVADGIVERGGQAEILGFDVAEMKPTEEAIAEAAKRLGRLDILVANAGIAVDGLLLRVKEEDIDRVFDVNVKGALASARAATKVMMRAPPAASSSSPAWWARWATRGRRSTRPPRRRSSASPRRWRASTRRAGSPSTRSRRASSTPT